MFDSSFKLFLNPYDDTPEFLIVTHKLNNKMYVCFYFNYKFLFNLNNSILLFIIS